MIEKKDEKPKKLVICPECDTELDLNETEECPKCELNVRIVMEKARYNRALRKLESADNPGEKKKKKFTDFNPFA